MIRTMLWMGWTMMKRDKVVLMLTFLLPVAFFSIFVGIFGSMVSGGGGTSKVELVVVDQDRSEASRRFAQALSKDPSLAVTTAPKNHPEQPYDRETAWALVKKGDVSVAAIIPKGFGETFGSFDRDAAPVELLADKRRDPVAYQMVGGLMQRAAMVGTADLMIQKGIDQFDKYAGGLTDQQRAAMDKWLPLLREKVQQDEDASSAKPAETQREAVSGDGGNSNESTEDSAEFAGMVQVKIVDVQREHKTEWEAFVSFQAAQTAVMFLLFSMAGAAGTLLDEQDSGTLERVLTSNVGMTGLLVGKWLMIALIGAVQLTVMFLWGALVFKLALFTIPHVLGFAIMTACTAGAGAGFGMMLATACRSRGQLGGVSTIIILIMSAVGGSMFPRFMMSATMKKIGLGTFNGWALDGYQKVFYDNLPLWQLWPQALMLGALTVAFLLVARVLARRWESQ